MLALPIVAGTAMAEPTPVQDEELLLFIAAMAETDEGMVDALLLLSMEDDLPVTEVENSEAEPTEEGADPPEETDEIQ